jgi:hypothetical protein
MLVEFSSNLFDTVLDARNLLKCPGLENVFPSILGRWIKIVRIHEVLLELRHEVHCSLVYGGEVFVRLVRVGCDHMSFLSLILFMPNDGVVRRRCPSPLAVFCALSARTLNDWLADSLRK